MGVRGRAGADGDLRPRCLSDVVLGGWGPCALGYATSRDGIHWRKLPTNPVLGMGRGGAPGQACHSSVFKSGRRWYAYYSSRDGPDGDRSLRAAVSVDGIRWRQLRDPVLLPNPASDSLIVNTSVVRAKTGLAMLYEAAAPPDYLWRLFAATAQDSIWRKNSTWRKLGMLPSLDVGGTYGGPWLELSGNRYRLWFHASTTDWVLPTDVYYSESTDLLNWTKPVKVLAREQPWQVDQVADPSVVTVRGRSLLFFTGADNPRKRAAIGVAIR